MRDLMLAAIRNLMKSDTAGLLEPRLQGQIPVDASPTTAGAAGLTRSPRPDTGKLKPGQFAKFIRRVGIAVVEHTTATTPPLPVRECRGHRSSSRSRKHSFDDANHRSAFSNSAPYQRHLYSSLLRKPDMPASADGPGQTAVHHHPSHVERLHHHTATSTWLSPSWTCGGGRLRTLTARAWSLAPLWHTAAPADWNDCSCHGRSGCGQWPCRHAAAVSMRHTEPSGSRSSCRPSRPPWYPRPHRRRRWARSFTGGGFLPVLHAEAREPRSQLSG